ncbi:MAG TPA: ribonuclease HII [Verrucomicrobiae bacterium]|nr:ribonuclease HII [Verrucomicrobiae bacterium]
MLFEEPERDLLKFEEAAARAGYSAIAGVDEAGRGPLAGPVVSAAVILPPGWRHSGINDSKQLTAASREMLYEVILENAVAVAVGVCTSGTIDRLNILRASLESMKKAVKGLTVPADYLLVDGTFRIPMRVPQRTIVGGDGASLSVAAASIVAKVTRDRMMVRYDRKFPGYGFADHKGYACAAHRQAIARLGPCSIHRKTFSGVREHLPAGEPGEETPLF